MSGFTGLASTNRSSAPETEADPVEWGDMDPNFRQALQNSPELLKAYNTVRNPKKVARLDPATNSFTPTTNIDLPFPSVETPPPQVTMEPQHGTCTVPRANSAALFGPFVKPYSAGGCLPFR